MQAEYPDIDFMGLILGTKDEKKAKIEEQTKAKLAFKVKKLHVCR